MTELPTGVLSLRAIVQVTVHRDGTIVLERGEAVLDHDTGSVSIPRPFRSVTTAVDEITVVTSDAVPCIPNRLPDSSTRRGPGALARAIAWLITGRGRP